MNNQILAVGSINMDISVQVETLPKVGESIHGKTIKYVVGGKGANQAIAAARLGGKVSMIGKIGTDDFGESLLSFLQSENIDLDGVQRSPLSSGLALIMVEKSGKNTIVILPNSNSEVTAEYISKNYKLIKKSNIILSQYEIPLKSIEAAFKISKKNGKITILNPSPVYKTQSAVFENTDYLVLNQTELSFFNNLSKPSDNTKEIIKQAKKLKLKIKEAVIVTIGERGAITITDDNVIITEGLNVNAVDTTAAGDCFIGALAVQLSKGVDLGSALDFANRAAAISVQKLGASTSLPTLSELGIHY